MDNGDTDCPRCGARSAHGELCSACKLAPGLSKLLLEAAEALRVCDDGLSSEMGGDPVYSDLVARLRQMAGVL